MSARSRAVPLFLHKRASVCGQNWLRFSNRWRQSAWRTGARSRWVQREGNVRPSGRRVVWGLQVRDTGIARDRRQRCSPFDIDELQAGGCADADFRRVRGSTFCEEAHGTGFTEAHLLQQMKNVGPRFSNRGPTSWGHPPGDSRLSVLPRSGFRGRSTFWREDRAFAASSRRRVWRGERDVGRGIISPGFGYGSSSGRGRYPARRFRQGLPSSTPADTVWVAR